MVQNVSTDEAVEFARGLIAELRERRLSALAGVSTKIDPVTERRIALEVGGDELKELAKRRHGLEEAAKRTRRQADEPRNTTTNFASARMYEKARRQDVEIERAAQKARQARAKFQFVYDAVIASEAFAERLRDEMAAADPAYARVAQLEGAISGVEALVDIWIARKGQGHATVAVDFGALRDMAPYDAARRLMQLVHGRSGGGGDALAPS
ncbi:hypothetical protein T8K17_19540 [Thalassobaculum sp. OXR-137]|uniref:hypothetical protein n=1 Tax=Thalassobaculum sp. OXR-137 TaxID=3100173 RepID=UPI002AC9DB60|nr:hypothetical protein [Thalassobaculum sp. OXR-137]WPZ33415.1 hypothetical protein T8K17_19540 [Thalassobaculum sp. OXR-137]